MELAYGAKNDDFDHYVGLMITWKEDIGYLMNCYTINELR